MRRQRSLRRKSFRDRLEERFAAIEAGTAATEVPPLHPRSPLVKARSANDTDTSSSEVDTSGDSSYASSGEGSPLLGKREPLSKSGRRPRPGAQTLLDDLNEIFHSMRALARRYSQYAQSGLFASINRFTFDGTEDADEVEDKLVHAACRCVDAINECMRMARSAHRCSIRMLVEIVFDYEMEFADCAAQAVTRYLKRNPLSPRSLHFRPKQRRRRRSPRKAETVDTKDQADEATGPTDAEAESSDPLPTDAHFDRCAEQRNVTLRSLYANLNDETEKYGDAVLRIEETRQKLLRILEASTGHVGEQRGVLLTNLATG